MARPERLALGVLALSTALAWAAAEVPIQEREDMAWWRKSMETRDQRLGWWREARFGMFIHWGAYSHAGRRLGGRAGGAATPSTSSACARSRRPSTASSVVAPFNPTGFDADEWVRAAKRAGMGYFIITAKHHDGFAMYDSAVSDYNVVKATAWKRDPDARAEGGLPAPRA